MEEYNVLQLIYLQNISITSCIKMDKMKIICNNLRMIFPLISVLFMNSISHISLPVSMVESIYAAPNYPSVTAKPNPFIMEPLFHE